MSGAVGGPQARRRDVGVDLGRAQAGVPQELLEQVQRLDRKEYKVEEMMSEAFLDLDQIVQFLEEAKKFEPKHDDKLKKLVRLLQSKELAGQKILIFTEFADTARYLKLQLEKAGVEGVAQVDSATKANSTNATSAKPRRRQWSRAARVIAPRVPDRARAGSRAR